MISPEVMQELLAVRQVLHYLPESQSTEKGWSPQEQQIFWAALAKYPQGPWTTIASFIGTKTTRQAMTHAQKLRQKLKRWNTRLRSNPAVSSLMDGVTVTADGSVTIPTRSEIPFTASSFPGLTSSTSDPSSRATRFVGDTSGHEPHFNSTRLSFPNPTEHRQDFDSAGARQPIPFMLGLHPDAGMASGSMPRDEMHAAISHDFVDSLFKSLCEEDLDVEDEVTEEQLNELGDEEDYRM